MKKNRHLSEAALLEKFRVSLENAEKQPIIKATMAEFGYDSETIQEGKDILQTAMEAYHFNKKEDVETMEAFSKFKEKKENIHDIYILHRKKAKIIFLDEPVVQNQLLLDRAIPRTHIRWSETIQTFYRELSNSPELVNQLQPLKVTAEEIAATIQLIKDMGEMRAYYLQEKGESQEATILKDTAIGELEDWMRRFYMVAKIAMGDNRQLLESINIYVRS